MPLLGREFSMDRDCVSVFATLGMMCVCQRWTAVCWSFAIVEDYYSMTLMMVPSVDGSLLSSYMKVLKWRVLRRVLVMRSLILR